jgi:hypothetical protein
MSGIDKYKRFDDSWKSTPSKTRGIRLTIDDDPTLRRFQAAYIRSVNALIQIIHRGQDLILGYTKKGKPIDLAHRSYPTLLKGKYPEAFSEFGDCSEGIKRSIAFQAVRCVNSFLDKHGAFTKTVQRLDREAAIQWKDFRMRLIGDCLRTELFNGEKHDLNFRVSGTMGKKLKWLPKQFGGNLTVRDDMQFIARTVIPIQWSYNPVAPLGMDIGKVDFIRFSQDIGGGNVIHRTPEIERLEVAIKELNKSIKSEEIKTKQRQRRRWRWKRLHKKHREAVKPICERIVRFAEENQLLLCIDDNAAGKKMGTFSQDKLVRLLIEMCENRGVPFVLVPTPHTSMRCSSCGNISRENRGKGKDRGSFRCVRCGFAMNSDDNAAINISQFGWKIWSDGVESFWKWKKEQAKPRLV